DPGAIEVGERGRAEDLAGGRDRPSGDEAPVGLPGVYLVADRSLVADPAADHDLELSVAVDVSHGGRRHDRLVHVLREAGVIGAIGAEDMDRSAVGRIDWRALGMRVRADDDLELAVA